MALVKVILEIWKDIPDHKLSDLIGSGQHPDQGLPQPGGRPDQGLPGRERPVDPGYGQPEGGHPDQGLPGYGHPDQGLPQPPVDPGFGQGRPPTDPGYGQGHPVPPHVSTGPVPPGHASGQPLPPGQPPRPSQGLPPTPQPKK